MGLCASTLASRVNDNSSNTSKQLSLGHTKESKRNKQSKESIYRAQVADDLFNPQKKRPSTLSLISILHNELLQESFRQFIKQTKCGVNRKVDFWIDSCSHEMLPYDPCQLRYESANKIFNKYFSNYTTACTDLELDINVIHDIATTLQITFTTDATPEGGGNDKDYHHGTVSTKCSPDHLRSAFVMATGKCVDLCFFFHPVQYPM